MENMAELGIGGLFAITVLKTLLPYVKPAKNGHVAKSVCDTLTPIMDRQTNLLEKMNERDILTDEKVKQIFKEMPKRNGD